MTGKGIHFLQTCEADREAVDIRRNGSLAAMTVGQVQLNKAFAVR